MIYADYSASAPLDSDVREFLIARMKDGPEANPNAIHQLGAEVHKRLERSRQVCAEALGAKAEQLIFNSGSTEGVSTIMFSLLMEGSKAKKKAFIISCAEHSCVYNNAKFYADLFNLELKVLPVLETGVIDFDLLKQWVNTSPDDYAMVSVVAASSETGAIQPFKEIAQLCNEKNIPYFCDTTPFVGKRPFDFKTSGVDYAVVSGHKIGALTGTGILLAKDPTKLRPLVIGSGQENNLRGGTQNYIGNETLAVACSQLNKHVEKMPALQVKKLEFEARIKHDFDQVTVFADTVERLPNVTYLAYRGIHGQAVQIELESNGIYVTTSSACADNGPVTSPILKGMHVSDDVGRGAIRISLGADSDVKFYDKIYESLSAAYKKLAKIKSY